MAIDDFIARRIMRIFYKGTLLILTICLITACSRKKNTFVNRNMHALSTEYNVLYNGDNAYRDSKKQLAAGFRDNYWEILPIERMEIEENLETIRGEKSGNFDRAEEKATKAIQKHSMYINGKEHNTQIDEAYMLLGKARYYDGRFIPALDAFNFILDRYPESNSVNSAKVWKAKTNIRLKNEEQAIENLKKMLEQNNLSKEDRIDGAAMLAQAYVNLDSLPQALEFIKIASESVKDNELKGRYTFIKGQLYNQLGEKDSANMAFDRVIALKRKTSRSYYIQAFLEKSKNFDPEKENKEEQLEILQDLAKDRENRPYLDAIYYAIAEFYLNNDRTREAVENYNKSIKNFKSDRILQSKNYLNLAEINFNNAEYRTAGAYYDSTLIFMEDKSREWRRVKKKRENLDDVIRYEDIAVTTDSILGLIAMNEAERLEYFTKYTNDLKEKARRDSIAVARQEKGIADKEFYKKDPSGNTSKGGTFYFYNPQTLAYGKQEFRKIWGDRANEDNWRISAKTSSSAPEEQIENITENTPAIDNNELFDPQTYISQIPTETKVIDSIHGERNHAYYQLGLIYKEKFKEYDLAANRLENVLKNNPEERLVVPSQYNLVKIYEILGNEDRVAFYKNEILTNHPESRYAEILRNPDSQLPTDESSPEFKYKELFKRFEAQEYAEVIHQSEEYIRIFDGNDIVPKFELLKATAIGRQDGFNAYKQSLNFVALTYPNSEEGKQAQEIIKNILPGIQSPAFVTETSEDRWKLVYKFAKNEKEEALKLKTLLEKAITELHYSNMTTSLDYYNPEWDFLIVHGLHSELGAKGFGTVLKDKKEYKVKRPFFEISGRNYQTLQIHKNLEDYFSKDKEASKDRKTKAQQDLIEEEEKGNSPDVRREIIDAQKEKRIMSQNKNEQGGKTIKAPDQKTSNEPKDLKP